MGALQILFGSLDITLDQEGLAVARELKALLDLTVAKLESMELPAKVTLKQTKSVPNPFA